MKTHSPIKILRAAVSSGIGAIIVTTALLVSSGGIQAQAGYSLTWGKLAGGGGTSTNGQYSLSGTIGQPDAGGPMTGGNYSITGGFWSPFAVQTPGAPLLRIFMTSSNTAVIAWPAPSPGWILESCSNLAAPNWSAIPGTNSVVGNENQFVIPSPTGNRFFRLAHPYPQDNVSK